MKKLENLNGNNLIGKRILVERKSSDGSLSYEEKKVIESTKDGKCIHIETRYTNPSIVLRWVPIESENITEILEDNPEIEKLREIALKDNNRYIGFSRF